MSFFDRLRALAKKENVVSGTPAPVVAPGIAERRNRKRKNARRGATALIIDDSPTVVAVLRKILRSAGYVTKDAGDAERGLAIIAEAKPDLIFLDIVLPGMNGFGALRAIRKDPSAQHIPVVMISGNEHATEQFYANKGIGGGSFSPDESKLLVHSNETGIFNLYEINLADQSMTAITKSTTESIFAVDYVPGTGEILYAADKGGNEIADVNGCAYR